MARVNVSPHTAPVIEAALAALRAAGATRVVVTFDLGAGSSAPTLPIPPIESVNLRATEAAREAAEEAEREIEDPTFAATSVRLTRRGERDG